MKAITDFLMGLGAWNWFILAAVMLVLETIIPGLHFIWFGVAALIVGALLLAVPMPIAAQIAAFAGLSVLVILLARRFWKPDSIPSDEPGLNTRAMQYVGRTALVVEAISGGRGRIQLGDGVWTARGPDTPVGATVRITGANGTVLDVAAV